MNSKHSILLVLFAVLMIFTSCLSDNETTLVYYDDASLSSFYVNTAKRTYHVTTSKGKDSTYVSDITLTGYSFCIDEAKGLVFNVDSLPDGVNLKKCLVTVTARNSGRTFIKSLTSDSLSVVTSTDSIDFSQPRVLRVFAQDGTWNKDYTVSICVHQEKQNKLYWYKKQNSAAIASLSELKAVCFAGNLIVTGVAGNEVKMYTSNIADGIAWQEVATPFKAAPSIVTDGTQLYAYDGNKVYRSADAAEWTVANETTALKCLAGASRSEVYGLSETGLLMKSNDKGATWSNDQIDSDAAYLPQLNVNGVCLQSEVNPDIDKMIIMGNRGVEQETTSVLWAKVVDNSSPEHSQPWMYQPFTAETWHHAPAFANMSIMKYGQGMLMLGSLANDGNTAASNFGFYYSWDEGLNWWKDKRFTLPAEFACSPASFAVVSDTNKRFWIICAGTGDVWQGYYSTWAWD